MLRLTTQGDVIGTAEVAFDSLANVRVVGDRLVGWVSSQQQWVQLDTNGQLDTALQQRASAQPGRPVGAHDQIVVKTAGDHEALVAIVGPEGVKRLWSLRTTALLGQVEVANVSGDQTLVVVSEFDEDQGRFHIVRLGPSTVTDVLTPDERFGEMTARSIFRLGTDALYQARSTPSGFAVYRYDMPGPRGEL